MVEQIDVVVDVIDLEVYEFVIVVYFKDFLVKMFGVFDEWVVWGGNMIVLFDFYLIVDLLL